MLYRIYFFAGPGKEYFFHGRKYLQKDGHGGVAGALEILHDFTTLYGRLIEIATGKEIGSALMKFRTFEDADAVLSFGDFLKSFNVIGSDDPFVQARGMLQFMALTNQFVVREYDPANANGGFTADEVREAALRGATEPDHFSARPTDELQTIMRETKTLPLATLINRGGVRIDFDERRIHRDAFWRGSFAKDTLLGWEERLRGAGLSGLVLAPRRATRAAASGSASTRYRAMNSPATWSIMSWITCPANPSSSRSSIPTATANSSSRATTYCY